MQFKDKIVLITGGTSGIGKATAIAFAREGAKVVITGRREKEGKAVVNEITHIGGRAEYFLSDVSKEADAKAAVEFTVKTFGKLDIAFNNAGIEGEFKPIHEQTEENYRQTFDINVGGVLWAMKYEIPALLANGGGSIVNTSSALGVTAMAGAGPYVASKHAVIGLTKTAALEYAKSNIRVNTLAPAVIATEMIDRATGGSDDVRAQFAGMHPVGRLGTSEEMASAVLYLSSPGASFVTGTTFLADGGWTAQ
jgi:NAD(P)-dependent dehydrogenase (short-subunit alcohol dehydrogenase family)